jgi:hypothetical protein
MKQDIFRVDPFCPTEFTYVGDNNGKIVSCIRLSKSIPKIFPEFYQQTIYHFTNSAKEILRSGVFRFCWQMRNNGNTPDEVLSKYWFVEANEDSNGLHWQTHGNQWDTFSLAQITRTACFFTGKKGSRDADLMRKNFGRDIIVVDYSLFKKDIEQYCLNHNKKLFINKANYVKYEPKDFYPLPILGKTIGAVGLEVSEIIDGFMRDGTCFNKTKVHEFEHELRFIFFDEYATLDPSTEFIEVPISKETMWLL